MTDRKGLGMERYIIVERYADNGELSHRALVDSIDGRELGTDGGEPEDQSFWRDWVWVPDELNKAQATVEALQAQLVTLKRHADLDCGDQSCLYALAHSGMRTNGGCRCSPKRMKDDLERSRKAVEALQRELLEWKRVLCNLTPGGSEFADDHAYCAEWVRKARENQHDIIISKHRELKATQAALNAERQRARTATQLVVETIGATGPEDLESALGRLVAQLDAERGKVRTLERVTQEDVDTIAGLKRDLAQLQALVRAAEDFIVAMPLRLHNDHSVDWKAGYNHALYDVGQVLAGKRTLDATTPAKEE